MQAASPPAFLLAERGYLDQVRARADAGDRPAAYQLARMSEDRGDLDKAAQILRPLADAGDEVAAYQLARMLEDRGDLDKAAQILRPLADAGDEVAARRLFGLLSERGDLDQAEQILRARIGVGVSDRDAWRLAELLTQQGRGEEAERLRRFGLAPDGSTASG